MTICYFGMYASGYARNKILIKGFRENSINVIECNNRSHLIFGFRYLKLLQQFISIKGWTCNVIFVGFPGQTDVPLAWFLGKIFNKKVIFDAFISTYNSLVFDRKQFSEDSIRAKLWWFVDWLSCHLTNYIILDTNEHIKYFAKTFGVNKLKFTRVFVGTDTKVFRPGKPHKHKQFLVGFHGSYLPLQGVDVIVETAKLLRKHDDIRFRLLGNGLERKRIEMLINKYQLSNVDLLDPVPYEDLPSFIASNDIYLCGPFGVNAKSSMVIPNKAYEAIAVKIPTIIGESPATKELFINNVNCLLSKQGDPKSLAKAITKLKSDPNLREKIATGGYNLMVGSLTPKLTVRNLAKEIKINEHD